MGSKREHTEVETPGPSYNGANKRRKQWKNKPAPVDDGSSGPPGQSLNELKKRARDIQRLFSKADSNMRVDVQRNMERELAHIKTKIEDLDRKKRRSDMIGKYHHVRFYERQKAERLRKQLKKRLDKADDPDEKAKLEEEFHIADVDWHYAKYFPFLERYVGLYLTGKPTDKPDETETEDVPTAKRALHSERPPAWKEIEAAMAKGERALKAIQERSSERSAPVPQTRKRPQDSSGKKVNGETEKKETVSSKKVNVEKENMSSKNVKVETEKKENGQGKALNRTERRRQERAQRGAQSKPEKEEKQKADGEDAPQDALGGFFAV